MGVLSNVSDYLHGKPVSVVNARDDRIAALSVLDDSQLIEIEKRKEIYLDQFSTLNGNESQDAIARKLGAIGVEVYQAYRDQLREVYDPVRLDFSRFNTDNRIRYFDITKWVTDAEEQSLDKLVNVYQVLNNDVCNIALIYHRTKDKCAITLGVVNTNPTNPDPSIADNLYSRVIGALRGNFPGSEYDEIDSHYLGFGIGIPESLYGIAGDNTSGRCKSVVSVSNVPSDKSEGFISQSMEKLLDGIVPESDNDTYTIVLLARPVKNISDYKNRLYELYTSLSPFSEWQSSMQYSQSDTEGSSASLGVNGSINIGNQQLLAANFGVSFSHATNIAIQQGLSKGYTQSFTNYGVKHTLEIIEEKMKKIEESAAFGMWEFSSYFVSENPVIANNAAHMYLALTQGDNSYLSSAAVNFWDGDIDAKEARIVLSSVQRLQHPVFGLKTSLNDDWLMYPSLVTPTTLVSGRELARALNFPRKSVSGVPVLEVVPFGREPQTLLKTDLDLVLGSGYHMRKTLPSHSVSIASEELTKHTFITGSTGSGKSNLIYTLLSKLRAKDVGYLVIEPAKGEYKDVIGKEDGVLVYGTNPLISSTQLLRVNPFRFPPHTHVLEHLDRLVEIFNVCWPMYAAMPAILKNAIERAYESCGWDLEVSRNRYDENLFPSFKDVVNQIKLVLDESDYSQDNKGDYTGSLVTRLHSLTNGINGLVFSSDDIQDEDLFDGHVIVDLSRVGSVETKALIMGLLVLKLQEYRMEQRGSGSNINDSLKHITVLEEAHNLLKRTSTEQTAEGTNLLGKSVEMLANSIAEMRTYGEGFVIADQSPGLLDMSVIRNTNTKMILRLPDYSDRQLVGKAAGLTENQIEELAKLEKGVAAVFQSEWLEPVLCKIDKYETVCNKPVVYEDNSKRIGTDLVDTTETLLDCIMTKEIYRKGDRVDISLLKEKILKSQLDTDIKCDFLDYLRVEDNDAVKALRKLLFSLLNADKAIMKSNDCTDIDSWVHKVVNNLSPSIRNYSKRQIDLALALIVYEQSERDDRYNNLLRRFVEVYKERGGIY